MKSNKLAAVGVFSLFLLATVCSPALCLTFSDNFDTLDAFWWTAQTTGTGATISHSGGEIVMSQTAGTSGEANLVFNFGITGNYTAYVDYRLITWPADNDERIGLRATGIAVERISDSEFVTGAEGYLTDNGAAGGVGVYGKITANDTTGRLQIVKENDKVTGYYWNGAWMPIHTYDQAGDTLVLELSIWPQNLRANISVAFDNFSLNAPDTKDPRPPGPNPVPEPATMLLLGAGLIGLAGYGRKKLG